MYWLMNPPHRQSRCFGPRILTKKLAFWAFWAFLGQNPPSARCYDADRPSKRGGRARSRRFKSGRPDRRIDRVVPDIRRELPVASSSLESRQEVCQTYFKGENSLRLENQESGLNLSDPTPRCPPNKHNAGDQSPQVRLLGFVAFLVQLQPLCQKNRRLRRATRGGLAPPRIPPQPTDFLV